MVREESKSKRWEARISCGLYRPVRVKFELLSEWFGEKEPLVLFTISNWVGLTSGGPFSSGPS